MQTSYEVLTGSSAFSATAGSQAGVFIGIQQYEYGGLASPYLTQIGPYSATGTPFSVAAGRLSFTYGFKGPAVSCPPRPLPRSRHPALLVL